MKWVKEIKKPMYLSVIVMSTGIILVNYTLRIYEKLSLFGILLTILGFYAVIQMLIFYRDPDRCTSAPNNMLVSPADGKVVAIEEIDEKHHINGKALRVAIFMHVGNVHIQRMPIEAIFLWQKHLPGKYFPAFNVKAAKLNEQRWFAFEKNSIKFSLVQIAGLLARRTNCWLKTENKLIPRNEKIGMITLGSEIDLYLPLNTTLTVKRGDKVIAGESIIGEWN